MFLPVQEYYHPRINHLALFLNAKQKVRFQFNQKFSEILFKPGLPMPLLGIPPLPKKRIREVVKNILGFASYLFQLHEVELK